MSINYNYNVINGYKNPKFEIVTSQGTSVYELPLTNSSGLIETYEVLSINHMLHDYTNLQQVQGYHIRWTLHYNEYVKPDTLLKIKEILEAPKHGFKLFIIPRADMSSRKFEVNILNDEIALGILKGGINATGHRLPVLEFKTVYKQEYIDWRQQFYFGSGYQSPTRGMLIT
jgi:hypothetical protein